ncbi:MAG: methyltransferase, partial [Clostridium sp.]
MPDKQDEIKEKLDCFFNEHLERMICSNPRVKDDFIKMVIRPVLLKDAIKFQVEEFTEKQAFHKNLEKDEAILYVMNQLEHLYRNAELTSMQGTLNLLISKKGTVTIKEKKKIVGESTNILFEHNRKKQYILEEGIPVPFLVDLGVMTSEGMVVKAKYDKFRQINRFLEFIEDVLPRLDKNKETTIIDFGCGKSYLTFAMYYYLKELKGYPIQVVGLDLKKDVITLCNKLSETFGFENLHFYHGDIAGYEGVTHVDM